MPHMYCRCLERAGRGRLLVSASATFCGPAHFNNLTWPSRARYGCLLVLISIFFLFYQTSLNYKLYTLNSASTNSAVRRTNRRSGDKGIAVGGVELVVELGAQVVAGVVDRFQDTNTFVILLTQDS